MESVQLFNLVTSKTVLTRIISAVRVPSLYPSKDNAINRDDEVQRSSLSEKHVVDSRRLVGDDS